MIFRIILEKTTDDLIITFGKNIIYDKFEILYKYRYYDILCLRSFQVRYTREFV